MVPVEKNKEYILTVESVTSEGSGVAHLEGYTIFVPQTAAGDIVRALIVKVKSRYGYGKMLELLTPSPDRQTPPCNAYQHCGGCQIMHLSYPAQLQFKSNQIRDALERIGGFSEIRDIPVEGMEHPFAYRNKMVFPVGEDENGQPVCGFYAQRSHRIIPLSHCSLGADGIPPILEAVLAYMKENHVRAYNETQHLGLVRRIFIRTAKQTGEMMVVLSVNGTSVPQPEKLVQQIREASGQVVSILLNCNTKRTNLVLGEENKLLWGKERITDTLCGITYEISPHSFFQINPEQTEKLYRKAISFAGLAGDEAVMDLYCGIGTISLYAAQKARHVTGVEIVPAAVEDARKNAERAGITNVDFYADSAEHIVPQLIQNGERPDVVILDPPRKGSDEKTLSAIVQAAPKRIVYVSCNPATLARDAKFLAQYGYRLEKAEGFDLFPHTVHVETVALLTHKKSVDRNCTQTPMDKKEILSSSGIEEQVLREICDLAKKYGVDKVILFGSRARGTYKKTSDIDIAVSGGDVNGFAISVDEETSTLLEYDIVNLDGSVQEELKAVIKKEGKVFYEKI